MRRDSVELGSAALGVAIPLDPGEHLIVIEAPGKVPFEKRITIEAGAGETELVVPPLADVPVEKPPPPPDPPPDGEPPTQQIFGYVLGGVGVVGLAIGIALAVRAQTKSDDVVALCASTSPAGQCVVDDAQVATAEELHDDARTAQAASVAGFVVGGALLVTGVMLLLLTDEEREVVSMQGTSVVVRW